jgi:ribosomal protein S18 acetylase RimI-like enzyme
MKKEEVLVMCEYCGKDAVYTCSTCGKMLCGNHAGLRTVCASCVKKTNLTYRICKLKSDEERKTIQEFVKRFWGEEEQLTFDRKFAVTKLPAYLAKMDNSIIGFISFAEMDDTMIIVALGVLPKYQNAGVGRGLIRKVEDESRRLKKKKLLVSTSNDDLPALAFYQSNGFQIYEVKPNVIAEKHGMILKGIGGLPVRDELRLQKLLQ